MGNRSVCMGRAGTSRSCPSDPAAGLVQTKGSGCRSIGGTCEMRRLRFSIKVTLDCGLRWLSAVGDGWGGLAGFETVVGDVGSVAVSAVGLVDSTAVWPAG